jgi:hypothetical protein
MTDILDVKPRYGDVMSNGIPGMAMPNMGADVVNSMRKTARAFAEAYDDSSAGQGIILQRANELEGSLLAAVTTGALNEVTGDKLVSQLHELIDRV